MKRLLGYVAVIMATLAAVYLLWQFRSVLGLFLFSLVLSAAVRPVVTRLVERRFPLALAVLLTYATGLICLLLLLYLISGSLLREMQDIFNILAATYERTHPAWLQQGTALQQAIAMRLPAPDQLYATLTGQGGELLVLTLFGVTRSFLVVVGGVIVALVMSIYWIADQNRFERLWLSLLPAGHRGRARETWQAIDRGVGAYVRSETVQSLLAGILLGLGYWLLGLPYPTVLGLLGALMWFIPLVGALFIALPVLVVGLLTYPPAGLAAAMYTIVVLIFLEWWIEPRLFNRRRFSSLLIVLTMVPLADAYGIVGLIAAPPLAAAMQILFNHLVATRNGVVPARSRAQVAELEARLRELRSSFATDKPPSPEIVNLMERLNRLIQRAQAVAPNGTALEKSRSG